MPRVLGAPTEFKKLPARAAKTAAKRAIRREISVAKKIKPIPFATGDAKQKDVTVKKWFIDVSFLNGNGEVTHRDVPASSKTKKPTSKTYKNLQGKQAAEKKLREIIEGKVAKRKAASEKQKAYNASRKAAANKRPKLNIQPAIE